MRHPLESKGIAQNIEAGGGKANSCTHNPCLQPKRALNPRPTEFFVRN